MSALSAELTAGRFVVTAEIAPPKGADLVRQNREAILDAEGAPQG